MKYFFILLLLSTSVFAQMDEKCKWADATVEYTGSNWALTPETFYAKVGDKVCVRFNAVDNAKSLRIQNQPIFMHAKPNEKSREEAIFVRKEGTFEVICGGCNAKAKIVVQSKAQFEQMQRKLDLLKSYETRNPHGYQQTNPVSPNK